MRIPAAGFEMLHEHQYPAYTYLLGMYLGDGCITHEPRTYRLLIYLNRNTPRIIATCAESVVIVVPHRRVGLVSHGRNCVAVSSYFGGWLALFPQHGPGKKHRRSIALEPWQRGLVRSYPGHFVRGCLHSDGCRHRRIVNGKDYPAYSFSNRSDDISELFCWACRLIGLRPRRATAVTVSIARRPDVARLDGLMLS